MNIKYLKVYSSNPNFRMPKNRKLQEEPHQTINKISLLPTMEIFIEIMYDINKILEKSIQKNQNKRIKRINLKKLNPKTDQPIGAYTNVNNAAEIFNYLCLNNISSQHYQISSFLQNFIQSSLEVREKDFIIYGQLSEKVLTGYGIKWNLWSHCINREDLKSVGLFKNGQLFGIGEKISKEKATQQGNFENHQLCGMGTTVFKNGMVWEGTYNEGQFQVGKVIFPDGRTLVGDFTTRNGNGYQVENNTGRVIEGNFVNGKLCGKGQVSYISGDIKQGVFECSDYCDTWKGEYIKGHGKWKDDGLFRDGYLVHGIRTFKNGMIWDGSFENGKLIEGQIKINKNQILNCQKCIDYYDGEATITTDRGDVIEGNFIDGQMSGQGKITHLDGNIKIGIFDGFPNQQRSYWKGKMIENGGQTSEGIFCCYQKCEQVSKQFHNDMTWNGVIEDDRLIDGIITLANGHEMPCPFTPSYGEGIRTNERGDIMEGNFKHGQLCGQGKVTTLDGIIKTGLFSGSEFHPSCWKGMKVYPDGRVESGIFYDDVLCSKEKFELKNGMIWDGFVRNPPFDVLLEGKITFPNGSVLNCHFTPEYVQGVRTDQKGNVLEGTFRFRMLYGKGKVTTFDGVQRIGVFKQEILSDNDAWCGKKIYKNGKVEEGEFLQGKLIQSSTSKKQ